MENALVIFHNFLIIGITIFLFMALCAQLWLQSSM